LILKNTYLSAPIKHVFGKIVTQLVRHRHLTVGSRFKYQKATCESVKEMTLFHRPGIVLFPECLA